MFSPTFEKELLEVSSDIITAPLKYSGEGRWNCPTFATTVTTTDYRLEQMCVEFCRDDIVCAARHLFTVMNQDTAMIESLLSRPSKNIAMVTSNRVLVNLAKHPGLYNSQKYRSMMAYRLKTWRL